MFKKFAKSLFQRGNVIQFELEDWHKWYKEPEKFHDAVVAHLTQEGKKVETVTVVKHVTSNKVSELLIDGVKYELTVKRGPYLGHTQMVELRKIDVTGTT